MLLFSLTLSQASAVCLVTGSLLWALLRLAQRRNFPARRSPVPSTSC